MAWTPGDWFAALSLAYGLISLGLAWLVYSAAPARTLNRALGVILLLEGMGSLIAGTLETWVVPVDDLANQAALHAAVGVAFFLEVALYPIFLGTALQTPLVAPFRWPWMRAALLVAVVPASLYALSNSDHFYFFAEGAYHHGELFTLVTSRIQGAVGIFALAAAIWSWLGARRGSAARRRSALYVLAFGLRDATWVFIAIVWPGLTTGRIVSPFLADWWASLVIVALLGHVVLLAYGILREQLLNIDLKLKWTLNRGTFVAALAVLFFLVKESIEFLLPLEGLLPSLAGAAAIGLVAVPAWRMAGGLARRMMPTVEDTREYRQARKREVYRAALEGATADGAVTARERAVLERLRAGLGLPAKAAAAMEREFTSGGKARL